MKRRAPQYASAHAAALAHGLRLEFVRKSKHPIFRLVAANGASRTLVLACTPGDGGVQHIHRQQIARLAREIHSSTELRA